MSISPVLACATDDDDAQTDVADDDGGQTDVGDGDDGQPDEGWVEGDRLAIREGSFPGGERLPLGWYDPELASSCSFGSASDGQLRCLPESSTWFKYYSSSDCAESSALLAAFPSCGAAGSFGNEVDTDTCPTTVRVFRLGARYSGDTYVRADGQCFHTTSTFDFDFFRRGEEVAPDQMVAGERILSGTSRLQRYSTTAEDGARGPTSEFRDTELGEGCLFQAAADGFQRCLPNVDFFFFLPVTQYSNESCDQPAILASSSCSQSNFASGIDRSTCDWRFSSYQLGAPVADPFIYQRTNGQCQAISIQTDMSVLPIGAEVQPSAFVAAEPELRGEGRVRTRWLRLEDGATTFLDLWDTLLETSCFRMALPDGTTVCAPSSSVLVDEFTYYSDVACMNRVTVASGGEACDRDPVALQTVAGCPGYRFYRLAGPVEADLFTFDSSTFGCRAVTETERAKLHELGEEIDPRTFEHAE